MQSAVLTGVFFVLCSYSVVLGFRGLNTALSDSTSPLHLLAAQVGVAPLGVAIDIGVSVAAFSSILACTTAAARVLLRMSHEGLMPKVLQRTSKKHGTPGPAIVLSAGAMLIASIAMTIDGVSAADIYDLLGSLSVFGFLTAYALAAAALPFARRALGQHSHLVTVISVLTVLVLIIVVVFDLESASDARHARIPYIYLGYLAAGLAWYWMTRKNMNRATPASQSV
jgi:amino acid transporter